MFTVQTVRIYRHLFIYFFFKAMTIFWKLCERRRVKTLIKCARTIKGDSKKRKTRRGKKNPTSIKMLTIFYTIDDAN